MANPEAAYLKTTIVFPRIGSAILLGLKQRGSGEGWWNGFGGKLTEEEAESKDYEVSAARETREEAGIHLVNLIHAADLHFNREGKLEVVSRAYLADYYGEPVETEEMLPRLWDVWKLPYLNMWPADQLWVPKILHPNDSLPLGFVINFGTKVPVESFEQVDPAQLQDKF